MITQEEIDKAADNYASEQMTDDWNVDNYFKAGVEWVLDQLNTVKNVVLLKQHKEGFIVLQAPDLEVTELSLQDKTLKVFVNERIQRNKR